MYYFSLRESLYNHFYGQMIPPDHLAAKEVLVAIIVALIILATYWLWKRWFFRIGERASKAKGTSLCLCIIWAVAWLIGSLELAGFRSFILMVVLAFLSLVGSLIYMFWLKGQPI